MESIGRWQIEMVSSDSSPTVISLQPSGLSSRA